MTTDGIIFRRYTPNEKNIWFRIGEIAAGHYSSYTIRIDSATMYFCSRSRDEAKLQIDLQNRQCILTVLTKRPLQTGMVGSELLTQLKEYVNWLELIVDIEKCVCEILEESATEVQPDAQSLVSS